MMYNIQDICCLCLDISNEKFSNECSKNPDNLTPYDKIKTVFLELSAVMKSYNRICSKCSEEVDSIYKFNKNCLKNINILNSYKKNSEENESDILVDLNELRQFKNNASKEVKVEPPESPLSNDDMLCDTDIVLESPSNRVVEVKQEFEASFESNYEESETSWLNPEIKLEEVDVEKVWTNEIGETSGYESMKPNIADFEDSSVQSAEVVIVKEEDSLLQVIGENSVGWQGHREPIEGPNKFNFDGKSFIQHENLRTEGNLHKCDVCGKICKRKEYLKLHMLIHTGDRPYKCDICDKSFTQEIILRKHMLIHTGEKPFKCEICGKSSNRKENLKLHMLIHTGERPYKCDICDKSFTQKDILSRHMVIHTGIKPYKCEICGKSSNRKENLKIHMLTHAGEKAFKCNICEKSFTLKYHLNRHMQTHANTVKKTFDCAICDASFTQNEDLRIHLETHIY